ncbi:MAG: CDP-alcohol phosphatidyltransferase family protein [Desulfobacterales bacterium]|jgi:phosphatidylglycerophosphate synthase|nr:CDP-alcohol phosphatidyltransferase family protein [Desulfobacterales bacterium]
MPLCVYFVQKSPVKIWGLTSSQRIERVLKAAGVGMIIDDLSALHDNDSVLILRTDYLFDDRLVNYLAVTPGIVLQLTQNRTGVTVAAHVSAELAQQAIQVIENPMMAASLPGVQPLTLETLPISLHQSLKKSEPPFVLPISLEYQRKLEQRLFRWSYKGVTDLVTKWVWPIPAQWMVGQCVRYGIRPNLVTLTGLLLVILSGILFAMGHFGWGLLTGWLMTFLDTVDGKLARVTVTSSRFGHYFDHLTDLFHPPIWYILWGIGLKTSHLNGFGISVHTALWLIVTGYIAGRLTEGAFKWRLGKFGIFCWRPVDSYFRLITARRNPNMMLLTGCFIMGRPDLGLVAVAFWTVATSVFLLTRLAWASYEKSSRGQLASWLANIPPSLYDQSLAVRLFTQPSSD